jgi:hypothetical protein
MGLPFLIILPISGIQNHARTSGYALLGIRPGCGWSFQYSSRSALPLALPLPVHKQGVDLKLINKIEKDWIDLPKVEWIQH